jgi:quercetin dioxygenase-like cupin family protein
MTETHTTTGTDRRAPHTLGGDLLYFRLQHEVDELRADLARSSGSRTAKTLAKSNGLRVTLVVVEAGVTIDAEAAAGASVLQVMDGRLRASANGEVQEVGSGELVVLSENLREPVEALAASAFLVTVAWPEGAGASVQEAREGRI